MQVKKKCPFGLGRGRSLISNAVTLAPSCLNFQRLEDYQRRLDTSNLKLSEYPNVEELRVRDCLIII